MLKAEVRFHIEYNADMLHIPMEDGTEVILFISDIRHMIGHPTTHQHPWTETSLPCIHAIHGDTLNDHGKRIVNGEVVPCLTT